MVRDAIDSKGAAARRPIAPWGLFAFWFVACSCSSRTTPSQAAHDPADSVKSNATAVSSTLAAIDVKSGAELWSMPVAHVRVVMVEWATGADIDRWAQATAEAKAP